MNTLVTRKYVRLEKRTFYPEDTGRVVAKLLTDHFSRYVDYDFTAAMEEELMDILGLDRSAMQAAQLLSLACLCRQNLAKGRLQTATAIFHELMAFVRKNLEAPDACAAS